MIYHRFRKNSLWARYLASFCDGWERPAFSCSHVQCSAYQTHLSSVGNLSIQI